LCRWLLLSLDRLSANELTMTQELIANMLGVRREGVTEAAGKLQSAGLIHYRRGRITVLDRPVWRRAPASATRWSRRSSIVSCPTSSSSCPRLSSTRTVARLIIITLLPALQFRALVSLKTLVSHPENAGSFHSSFPESC
jgi:DNA-binding transcriptional MocR family regulator